MAGSKTFDNVELFSPLSSEQRAAIAAKCRWRQIGAHSQILGYLDDTDDVYFVTEGRVRVAVYSASGREVSFRDVGAGEFFGEFAALDPAPRSANVITLTETVVAIMPAETFRDLIRTWPSISLALLRHMTRLVRLYSERVIEFSTLGVKNRVHAELLRLAMEHAAGTPAVLIRPAPTHAELAARIATHREAVTRELNDLARRGVIELKRGAIMVFDMERLAELVRGEVE